MRHFFPGHILPQIDNKVYPSVRNSKLDKTFTEFKVLKAFCSFGNFKCAGPDGLKPIVLKSMGQKAFACITSIMKASYTTGYIPLTWRESRVVFIPKPQKSDYSDVGSFRPISLMQFFFKPWRG